MATYQIGEVREFLTCVICRELYTDPCTLRCDHTFCRKCVSGYIQTRPDVALSKMIPCAFCRQDTKVPHPSRPVEEWAEQMKPSIIMQGLIDTQAGVVETDSVSCCSVCEKLGRQLRELAGDEKKPALRDVTVLVVDSIQAVVITDSENECVTSFYTRNNLTCHSELPLDPVWRCAPTGDRALSFPYGISTVSTGDILIAERVTNHKDVGIARRLHVDRHDTLYVCGGGQIQEINFMLSFQ